MGSKSSGAKVAEYRVSIHMGLCAADEGLDLLRLSVGGQEAWSGAPQRHSSVLAIDRLELFGGREKEGGIKGLVHWLAGRRTQILPSHLARKLGLAPEAAPGYRGVASLWFTDNNVGLPFEDGAAIGLAKDAAHLFEPTDAPAGEGFIWSQNNPYLKEVAARVRRRPSGGNPSIAMIRLPDDSQGREQWAANPAYMLLDCLTNREWGMGAGRGAIDVASYERAAQTLHEEGFGLAMLWTRQTSIERVIGEIVDHIQAAHYRDPRTGKLTLRLLRADYDPADLPTLDPANALLAGFQRKAWGETANAVSVTWTNPETEQPETVTAHDLAGIAAQGGVITTARNYYGVRSRGLAMRLAERDLAAAVAPIAACTATVAADFAHQTPGSVVALHWPEHGIERIVMRVMECDYGDGRSPEVTLKLAEDIFALDRADYLEDGGTLWVDPTIKARPPRHIHGVAAPAMLAARAFGRNDPGALAYPEAAAMLLVGAETADDIDVRVEEQDVAGGSGEWRRAAVLPAVGSGTLRFDAPAEARSTIALDDYLGPAPRAGDFLVVGREHDFVDIDSEWTAEEAGEVMRVEAVGADGLTVARGMLDTVPRRRTAGERAWIVPATDPPVDETLRAAGETAYCRVRPRTSGGLLPVSQAPEVQVFLGERAHLPLRPANVRLDGVAFGETTLSRAAGGTVTWATRNRATEASVALAWEDGPVAPESGQTTTVHLWGYGGEFTGDIATYRGLGGGSFAIPASDLAGIERVVVSVWSERDGMRSLQWHEIAASVTD